MQINDTDSKNYLIVENYLSILISYRNEKYVQIYGFLIS
jgi:hypothetical protein